ncbi:hypothetical protein SAMN05444505_11633 [Pseudomonas syringae]|uniref:Uncharacterized protein n=1 Tax=Pseudomonas syringae TaxID=317 RepID=A0AB37ZUL2_PSESX|nr:hypothetical protein SAMN05444505_11633 [Pseudomonas syringae]
MHIAYPIELNHEAMRRHATQLPNAGFTLTVQSCVATLRLPILAERLNNSGLGVQAS